MSKRTQFEICAGDNPPADGGGWVDVTRPGDKKRQWMLAYPSLPNTEMVRVQRSTEGTAMIDVPREQAHLHYPYSGEAKGFFSQLAQHIRDDMDRARHIHGDTNKVQP